MVSIMKKLIIICGCDRTGKDTLISQLNNYFNNKTAVIHAGIPENNCNLFDYYYKGLIHSTLDHYYHLDVDAIIHNRSMYGEYVYGPKYRNEKKEDIKRIISDLEVGQLKTFIRENELFFILLSSSNVDLLVNNSDGNSISDSRNDIKDELEAFDEIFNISSIKNKKKIMVNDGSDFRNKEDIYKEVIEFIS